MKSWLKRPFVREPFESFFGKTNLNKSDFFENLSLPPIKPVPYIGTPLGYTLAVVKESSGHSAVGCQEKKKVMISRINRLYGNENVLM